jgi:hypothetical protein
MKNNQSFGDIHRLAHGLPSDEHEFFYDCLLISPSYHLAHEVMTGETVNADLIAQVTKWDEVLGNYAVCGDVYSLSFKDWWSGIGRPLFYTPLASGGFANVGSLEFLTTKLNEATLLETLALVNDKARLLKRDGKKIDNWKLGVESKIRSKWTAELTVNSKKTYENLEARTTLGVLVSKKLKEALYLSENAARGEFPSITPIDSGVAFDYSKIYEIQRLNAQFGLKTKQKEKKAAGVKTKSYYERKVKPKNAKEKRIEQEVQKRLKLKLQG